MNRETRHYHSYVFKRMTGFVGIVVLAVGLSACGGGDSNSGGSSATGSNASGGSSTSSNNTSATFSSDNAQAIAGAILYASKQDRDDFPSVFGLGGGSPTSLSPRSTRTVATISTPTGTATAINCPGGGTYSIEQLGNFSAGAYTSGSGMKAVFNNCQLNPKDPATIDGAIKIVFSNTEGKPFRNTSDWTLVIKYDYDFSVTGPNGQSRNFKGSFSFKMRWDASAKTLSTSYSEIAYTTPSGAETNWSSNATIKAETNKAGNTEYTLNGEVTIDSLNATVTVKTLEPLEITNEGRLLSGQLLITNSADNSSIRLTAAGQGKLLIEVDADGDGNYEESKTVILKDLWTK